MSNIPVSVLDLAPVRDRGSFAESFTNSVSLAKHTEALGFHRFWLAEHHNIDGIASAATSVLIGHVASHTSRIRVGSGGIMLPNHPPLVIAEQFGTLETLYPGRIDLGLGRAPGADGMTMRALRRDPRSADDFPDQVEELLEYLGEPHEAQRIRAYPGQNSNVPVWLLGSSLFSANLAAHMGLPFAFASHFAPAYLVDAIQLYRERFRPSRYLETPYAMATIPVIAADTEEQAHYHATVSYQRVLNLVRGRSIRLSPPVDEMQWLPIEESNVRQFLGAAVIGDKAQIKQGLNEVIERTGIDELMISSDAYSLDTRLRSYEIIAHAMGITAP